MDNNEAKKIVKTMFRKNKDLTSLQAIDMARIQAEMELKEFLLMYKSPYHVEQILSPDIKVIDTPETLLVSGQTSTSAFLKNFFRGN
jgi:hypothetical protein